MFKIRFVLIGLLFVSTTNLFAQRDFFGIPTVQLGDTEFQLRWSSKTKQGRYMAEYLRKNENMTNFEEKIVVECASQGKTVENEVTEMMGKLALKKEQNIVFSFQQLEGLENGVLCIEYVQGNVQGGQSFTLEWNIARFKNVNGRVVMYRYIQRTYDKSLETFTKKIEKKKNEWLKKALLFDLNTVKVQD